MVTRILKIGVLVFTLLLLVMLLQIVLADDFDDAEVIDVGTKISFTASPHTDYTYRIWFDDPGHELIIKVHYGYFNYRIYNPRKERVFEYGAGDGGVITERGWHFIQIDNRMNEWEDISVEVTANPPNPDKFKVSGINIVPENAYGGENIAISFDVKNSGQLLDTCTAELIIDGVTKDTKDVTIDGGGAEKITFNIAADEEGTHNVEVSVSPIWSSISKEINGAYTVEHTLIPAKFEVSNLAIAPERVGIGDNVKITVDITNVGEVEGTYDVELYVDGRLEDSKMVTLSGGETKLVAFTIAEDYAGSYSVEVEGLSGAFEVVSPVSTPRATFTPKPTPTPSPTEKVKRENHNPVINSVTPTKTEVGLGGSVRIIVSAYDPDNDVLIYSWDCDDGSIKGPVTGVTWTAPDIPSIYKIRVKVKDRHGGEATDECTILVTEKESVTEPEYPTVTPKMKITPSTIPLSKAEGVSVYLHGDKTNVIVGEEAILSLSAVNLITKPTMSLQLILKAPSGMSITSTEFIESGAGMYTATYTVEPGKERHIGVNIKTNQVGEFNVEGDICYYFGGDKSTAAYKKVMLPVKVNPISISTETMHMPSHTETSGFETIFTIAGLLTTAYFLRKKR